MIHIQYMSDISRYIMISPESIYIFLFNDFNGGSPSQHLFQSWSGAPKAATAVATGAAEGTFHTWEMIWVNYNELTTSSLEIMVNKGNHPQMALIQVSELL